jgi:hypothetical protein
MPIAATPTEPSPFPIELDATESWPAAILIEIAPLLPAILKENQAELEYALSGDRWHKPSPPCHSTDTAHGTIQREMANRWISVFHATRLVDFDSVRREGLHPLNMAIQISAMKKGLVVSGQFRTEQEIDRLLAGVDLSLLEGREGQVWATPLRRLLHDGGCDVFFNHWGGEAIQRLAHMASGNLETAIRALGMPAVVTFAMPAFGCCTFGDLRLAPTMVGMMLERAGLIERNLECWDVLVRRSIPPEWIRSVLPYYHPSLASPSA